MTVQMIEQLKKLAAQQTCIEAIDDIMDGEAEDSFVDIEEYFDGKVDDAYERGNHDGQIELARMILTQLGIAH